MLPPFSEDGNLPPGIHRCAWDELERRFGTTPKRRHLLRHMRKAVDALRVAGCRRAYIDGSFVTAKPEPGDYDMCWDAANVDYDRLDLVLKDHWGERRMMKLTYLGDVFPAQAKTTFGGDCLAMFQTDKRTDAPKGIVILNLEA